MSDNPGGICISSPNCSITCDNDASEEIPQPFWLELGPWLPLPWQQKCCLLEKPAESRKGQQSPLETLGNQPFILKGRGTSLNLKRQNSLPTTSIQNFQFILWNVFLICFYCLWGYLSTLHDFRGDWRVTGLGEQGWEDCGFLQLSQLEVIYKAIRTEVLQKKPWAGTKRRKYLAFGFFSALPQSSTWQSRYKTQHTDFGSAC